MIDTEVQEPSAVVEETAAPAVDVPEAPETVSADAESAPTDTPVSDRPRDANGRFLKRDGTPVAPDEQAALTAASIPATATTSPAPSQTPSFAGDPFVFRAEGQRIPVPGATVDKDGWLHVPPDQVPVTKQLWAEGMAHRGSWRTKEADFQRQIAEAGSVQEARAEKYNAAAVFLHDKLHDRNWLQALVNDPDRELALLDRELGLELKTRDLKAPRVQEQPQAPSNEDQTADFNATLHDEVDELLEDQRLKGLFTPEEAKELKDDFTARMAAYAAEVDGQIMLDRHAVKRAFDREVGIQKRIKQAAIEAGKAREFNEKRNAPPAIVPPVVSTKGPGGTGTSARKFASKEEYNKAMGLS